MLKIKEIRENKNITQDDVVRLSGIKKRSYVDYENEKKDITLSNLHKIATALQVSVSELIGESETTSVLNEPQEIYETESTSSIDHLIKERIEQAIKQLKTDVKILQDIAKDKHDLLMSSRKSKKPSSSTKTG